MKTWFSVFADLFINLAAGWFAVVIIEPQISPINSPVEVFLLTVRAGFGIVCLIIAKKFREEVNSI